jgi:hypothetical protein
MKIKYIIECESKEELECINCGLDLYKKYLIEEIDDVKNSDYVRADYFNILHTVKDMVNKLEKDFG